MAWTNAKTVIVAGIGLLLAAGMVSKMAIVKAKEKKALQTESLWRLNFDLAPARIDALPPLVEIVPTKFASKWTSWNAGSDGQKWVGSNARLKLILACAYGVTFSQIQLQADVPTNHFDFVATLPAGAREALQQELKSQFGLVGHMTTVDTNVLLLKFHHGGGAGLRPPLTGKTYVYMTNNVSDAVFYAADEPLGHGAGFQGLADLLENHFKLPIVDQTGVTQHFQINLHWPEDETHNNLEGAKQAAFHQLGVELISTNMPVEMLMVEKVK